MKKLINYLFSDEESLGERLTLITVVIVIKLARLRMAIELWWMGVQCFSFKKIIIMNTDKIVLWREGYHFEDKKLLYNYRLAYVFANGINGMPRIYYSDGFYCIKHKRDYCNQYNYRQIKRMTVNLIKTRYDRKYHSLIKLNDPQLIKSIYGSLSIDEQMVVDGLAFANSVYISDEKKAFLEYPYAVTVA